MVGKGAVGVAPSPEKPGGVVAAGAEGSIGSESFFLADSWAWVSSPRWSTWRWTTLPATEQWFSTTLQKVCDLPFLCR